MINKTFKLSVFLLFAAAFSQATVGIVHASCNTIKVDPPNWGTIRFCDYNNNGTGEDTPPTEFSFVSCTTGQANTGPIGSSCCSSVPECGALLNPTATPTPVPTTPPGSTPTPTTGAITDPLLSPPGDAFFNMVDPLQHGGGQTILDDQASPYANQLNSPGGIVSRALDFAFPIAGLILFVMLVWAGFEILVGAPSKKSIDAGKQRATAALVGFLLLFATYWIFQIIEVVFGVRIL